MSHESVISALNALSKVEMISLDMGKHVDNLIGESDRASIILNASVLEHAVTHMLERALHHLNGDERARVFGVNGPLGTFSSKVLFAQGLGIIDRAMKKRLDIVRAMRNAAAHYIGQLDFSMPEIRAAVLQIASAKNRPTLEELQPFGLRAFFTHTQTLMSRAIAGGVPYDEELTIQFIHELTRAAREASRDKLPEQ